MASMQDVVQVKCVHGVRASCLCSLDLLEKCKCKAERVYVVVWMAELAWVPWHWVASSRCSSASDRTSAALGSCLPRPRPHPPFDGRQMGCPLREVSALGNQRTRCIGPSHKHPAQRFGNYPAQGKTARARPFGPSQSLSDPEPTHVVALLQPCTFPETACPGVLGCSFRIPPPVPSPPSAAARGRRLQRFPLSVQILQLLAMAECWVLAACSATGAPTEPPLLIRLSNSNNAHS